MISRVRALATVVAVLSLVACKAKKDDKAQPDPKVTKADAGAKKGTGSGSGTAKVEPPPPLETLAADPGSTGGALGWSLAIAGAGGDVARDLALTSDGGVIVVGDFEGDATFGALGAKSAVPTGLAPDKKPEADDPKPVDGFVMAIGADGKPAWVTTIGGKNEDVVNEVAIAADGSMAVAGLFSDVLMAGTLTARSNGSDDLYVCGLDAKGEPTWLWTTGGKADDEAITVVASRDGGYLVGGSYVSEVTFGDTPLDAIAGQDAFIVKLSKDGEVEWVKSFGGDKDDRISRLAVDVQGSIYALAQFQDKAKFGGDEVTSAGGYDMALIKLDEAGTTQWTKAFGGVDNELAGGLTVDRAGNVTVVGSYDQAITVDSEDFTANGTADALVIRFAPDGKVAWAKSYGGSGEDIAATVAADAAGNVLVGGWFEAEVDFGKGKVESKGKRNKDLFIAKLGPDGATTWVRTLGDRDHDKVRALAVNADGTAMVAGVFHFELNVTPPIESIHGPDDKAPPTDAFVLRVDR